MSSSVSHPGPVMHDFGDSPEDERLRGLNRQQLADRLTWLSLAAGYFVVSSCISRMSRTSPAS